MFAPTSANEGLILAILGVILAFPVRYGIRSGAGDVLSNDYVVFVGRYPRFRETFFPQIFARGAEDYGAGLLYDESRLPNYFNQQQF